MQRSAIRAFCRAWFYDMTHSGPQRANISRRQYEAVIRYLKNTTAAYVTRQAQDDRLRRRLERRIKATESRRASRGRARVAEVGRG